MENYMIHIGKSALAASAFYLFYLVLFQNHKQFTFNRIYLPVSLVLSFIIPLITFTQTRYIEVTSISSNTMGFLPQHTHIPAQPGFQPEWYHYFFAIYILGLSGFMFHLLLGYSKVISIIKKSTQQIIFSLKVKITKKDTDPFSFFNNIVIPEKIVGNPNLKMIIDHEYVHVKEKHAIDILISEIFFLLQWFNPFAWLLKHAIRNNLEYITDKQITKIHNPESYQLAMVDLARNKGPSFITSLNGSKIKTRIIMMNREIDNKYALIRKLVVIPLLATIVMGLSNKNIQTEIIQPEVQKELINSGKEIKGKVITDKIDEPLSEVTMMMQPDKDIAAPDDKIKKMTSADKNILKYDENDSTNNGANRSEKVKSANNTGEPVIFVDGNKFKGDINDINPDNIKSVEVLKEPSATMYYGQKGKNGVILIQTKSSINTGRYKPKNLHDYIYHRENIDSGVVIMPEFPGGQNALDEFISRNIIYPISAYENGIRGQVIVNFIISKSGKVTDIKLYRGVDPALDKEALRVVSLLPDWKPGIQNGKPVEVSYKVPVNFVLRKPAMNAKSLTGNLKNNYSDSVKITTELELRKFIADKIRYPLIAQKAQEEGTVRLFIRTNSNGRIIQLSEKAYGDEISLGEVVVVGYSTVRNGHNNTEKDYTEKDESVGHLKEELKKEVRRVINLIPKIEISDFQNEIVEIKVIFVIKKN